MNPTTILNGGRTNYHIAMYCVHEMLNFLLFSLNNDLSLVCGYSLKKNFRLGNNFHIYFWCGCFEYLVEYFQFYQNIDENMHDPAQLCFTTHFKHFCGNFPLVPDIERLQFFSAFTYSI